MTLDISDNTVSRRVTPPLRVESSLTTHMADEHRLIGQDQNIISIFPACRDFIEEAINSNGVVLAHCNGLYI
jgi:hypothetical protein